MIKIVAIWDRTCRYLANVVLSTHQIQVVFCAYIYVVLSCVVFDIYCCSGPLQRLASDWLSHIMAHLIFNWWTAFQQRLAEIPIKCWRLLDCVSAKYSVHRVLGLRLARLSVNFLAIFFFPFPYLSQSHNCLDVISFGFHPNVHHMLIEGFKPLCSRVISWA